MNGLLEALSSGLSKVPSALIAAALLAGPTAIWLIVRLTNPPDPPLRAGGEVGEQLLWVCAACRSINEDRVEQCYRCQRARRGSVPHVVIDVGPPSAPGVGIAVGPGRRADAPVPSSWLGGALDLGGPSPAPHERDEVDDVAAAMIDPVEPREPAGSTGRRPARPARAAARPRKRRAP